MRNDIIQETIDKSFSGTIIFPEVLKILAKEGVESYQVDFLRNENRYYGDGGESLVMEVEHSKTKVPELFSIEIFKNVLKQAQTGQINYAEFCKETKASGCAYYTVYLKGKQVRYFGRNGEEYNEPIPF